ncbi:MAG TPA: SRPBCC family protein [Mycobacteriales bacterium]|nr:SRPBCC family protein [Mycobacteriales bacterium]
MARNDRLIRGATVADVFAVLCDGSGYAEWVVGTRKIRDVDAGWPQPGARIHYTAGYWPMRKDDVTTSRGYEPEQRLELEAHAWPAGSVGIVITAKAAGPDVVVSLEESPAHGLLKTLHNPGFDLLIKARNVETLRRFEDQLRVRQGGRLRPASG